MSFVPPGSPCQPPRLGGKAVSEQHSCLRLEEIDLSSLSHNYEGARGSRVRLPEAGANPPLGPRMASEVRKRDCPG